MHTVLETSGVQLQNCQWQATQPADFNQLFPASGAHFMAVLPMDGPRLFNGWARRQGSKAFIWRGAACIRVRGFPWQPFGPAGGGADLEGPRFDLSVPKGGYGWWHLMASPNAKIMVFPLLR